MSARRLHRDPTKKGSSLVQAEKGFRFLPWHGPAFAARRSTRSNPAQRRAISFTSNCQGLIDTTRSPMDAFSNKNITKAQVEGVYGSSQMPFIRAARSPNKLDHSPQEPILENRMLMLSNREFPLQAKHLQRNPKSYPTSGLLKMDAIP